MPLAARAVEILRELYSRKCGDLVFSGRNPHRPMAKKAATTHWFRLAFRDWAGNETAFPREVAEQALAHAAGSAVEVAYRRSDALEKRRALMEAWASYCCAPDSGGNVIPIRTSL